MVIYTRTERNATIVSIAGRLDAVTAPEYEKKVSGLINTGNSCIVVDLEQLDYISSAGLRALLITAKLLKAKDGRVRIANIRGPVREVFTMSGFNTIFPMDDSVADSLAALS